MQPHSKMLFQVLTLNCSSSANCTSKLLDATILNSCRRDYDMQKWIHDTGQDLCIFRFMFEIFEMYNIIVYSIYIYIHILYVEVFSFFLLSHFSHFTVLLVLLESCMRSWFEDPGLPEWKLWIWWTIGIRNHGIWWNAQFLIECFPHTVFGLQLRQVQLLRSCKMTPRLRSQKKDMQKNPKKHNFGWRWSSILTPRGHQRSKLLFL